MEQIYSMLGISAEVEAFGNAVLKDLKERFEKIDAVAEYNQAKVLRAMQEERVDGTCFAGSTGYGYNDNGRDKLEKVYARCFGTDAALVRPQITCGTHALAIALSANLLPGDELLSPVGKPYDTLENVIGTVPSACSLMEYGVSYRQVELMEDGTFDYPAIREAINEKTKLVTIQRSKGGQAFLDRTHEEFNDLAFWWVRDDMLDAIPDISNEKIADLLTAFDGAALHGWEAGDNQPKLNRIKKALHDILGDEVQTENAFAIIAKEKYNVTFEPERKPDSLEFQFGYSKDGNDRWFTESGLLSDFAEEHGEISFAFANALMEYLDDKQHKERMIPDLNAGYYKKTNFEIRAVVDGQ